MPTQDWQLLKTMILKSWCLQWNISDRGWGVQSTLRITGKSIFWGKIETFSWLQNRFGENESDDGVFSFLSGLSWICGDCDFLWARELVKGENWLSWEMNEWSSRIAPIPPKLQYQRKQSNDSLRILNENCVLQWYVIHSKMKFILISVVDLHKRCQVCSRLTWWSRD